VPVEGSGAGTRNRRLPRWALAAAGLVVVVALAGGAALFLGGGGEADARARITDAALEDGVYTVWFETEGASVRTGGDSLVFYWNNESPEDGAIWTGGSPVSFTFAKPAGASRICIAVVEEGGIVVSNSGNCWTV
jgi:hypothetical protein